MLRVSQKISGKLRVLAALRSQGARGITRVDFLDDHGGKRCARAVQRIRRLEIRREDQLPVHDEERLVRTRLPGVLHATSGAEDLGLRGAAARSAASSGCAR